MKLRGKIFMDGQINTLTGLAIGGSKTDIIIGGIDSSVIKDSLGVPYIPGSSLKGKLRSLSEKSMSNSEDTMIKAIFGTGADKATEKIGPTRLLVRDAHLNGNIKEQMEKKEGKFKELELTYTEGKWENRIDRRTSKAEHPRQMERVPPGAIFDFQIIFNIFEHEDIYRFKYLLGLFNMLEDDYIGSSGSRGYGRISFEDIKIGAKNIEDYEEGKDIQYIFEEKFSQLTESKLEDLQRLLRDKLLGDE